MTKSDFLKLKKRIDLQLAKLTQLALDENEDITSQEFEEAILEVKKRLLSQRGITIEDYEQMLAEINEERMANKKTSASAQEQIFSQIKQLKGENGYTPIKGKDYFTNKEIEQIKDEVFSRIKYQHHKLLEKQK